MSELFISLSIIIGSIVSIIVIAAVFSYMELARLKKELEEKEERTRRNMYELAILKEIGERTGYSLNVQNIIDIITGSLIQFIDYSVASYMYVEREKIVFKVHLEKSVSREFIDEIKNRMLNSLSTLLDKNFSKTYIEEILSGEAINEDAVDPVRSFFNIPLVIGGKVIGILTVADIQEDLYHEEDMTILYKITKQASNAINSLQEVVATEQRKLSGMVESINEGVVMTDSDYNLMVANPAALNAVGIEAKDDLSLFDFVEKLDGSFNIREKLEECIKLDKSSSEEDVLINDKYFQIFSAPVKSSSAILKDEIIGAVVIFRDITPIKELGQMREDFTSMMVHELRSPLDNIKKISELLLKRKSSKTIAEYLSFIFQDSSRMLELVGDLLDVAKLEAGKFEIYKQQSDIKEIINERVGFFKTSAGFSKIKISTVFDKNIPAMANFDPVRIVQVLNNLISNAIKFTKEGGSVVIQVLAHRKTQDIMKEAMDAGMDWFIGGDSPDLANLSNSLIVAVTDTGIGLSKQKAAQLFNKFKKFKIAADDGQKRGTGLGLVVVKGIVEAHKGVVGVASKEGVGSTFYFVLPL